MPDQPVIVDADAEGFTIEVGKVKKKINVGELLIKLNTAFPRVLTRFTTFAELNSAVNHGDSIKDGTNQSTLEQLGLYQSTPGLSLQELKDMAHAIIEVCKQNGTITKQLFTNDKKGDNSVKEHYKGLKFDIGFDSGLGLDNYLDVDTPTKQVNVCETFGKYIDPSSFRDADISFPEQDSSIVIRQNAFNLLGYENCEITYAKRVGRDQYTYDIMIGGTKMSNSGVKKTVVKERNYDVNINTIFVGNKAKKSIDAKEYKEKKIAAIVGKSLGDKLQVFCMFIKSKLNDTRISSISTCDEIVLLFCILLGLPCFYTSKEEVKGKKLKEVLYFNPDNTNPTKARAKFQTEKNIVIKGYTDLIKMLRPLNGNSVIYVSGVEKPHSYPEAFFQGLVQDLEYLKAEVEAQTIDGIRDVAGIFQVTSVIQSMTVNNFIRQSRDKMSYLITRTANKYSNHASSYDKQFLMAKLGTSRKLTSATFTSIADSFQAPSTKRYNGGAKFPDYDEYFNMEGVFVYLEDGSMFDALEDLVLEVKDIVNYFGFDDVNFIDFYSELLHTFAENPDYSTDYLADSIARIYREIKYNEQIEASLGPIVHPIYSKKLPSPVSDDGSSSSSSTPEWESPISSNKSSSKTKRKRSRSISKSPTNSKLSSKKIHTVTVRKSSPKNVFTGMLGF
jgi:hypothetical protein